jgi:hypothetical protein
LKWELGRKRVGKIPSSTPYANSNGFPVSSQIGNGIYCNSFFSFEMCSPVSLFPHQRISYPPEPIPHPRRAKQEVGRGRTHMLLFKHSTGILAP